MVSIFSKKFTFDDIPDLTGKVALITGANTGMGFITAREIARKGAHVFVCSRSQSKGEAAVEAIKTETGNQQIEFWQLDLQNIKKVKSSAEQFLSKGLPIHILVNNAGVMATPFELTVDGIEGQMATNHVGHFVFTTTLLPRIVASAPSRIVNVSSFGHNITAIKEGIDFENINTEKHNIWIRYGQSKLANILFTRELARHLADKQVYVNSVNPGVVKTELSRGANASYGKVAEVYFTAQNALFAKSADNGALNQLYAATSTEIETKDLRGKYFSGNTADTNPSGWAQDQKLAEKLWKWSEEIVNKRLQDAD